MTRLNFPAVIFCTALLLSCSSKEDEQRNRPAVNTDSIVKPNEQQMDVRSEIYRQDNGWGYDIYIDDKLYIHQPHIPAVSGVQVFSSGKDAQAVADRVTQKLRMHEMPPSITPEELKELDIDMR